MPTLRDLAAKALTQRGDPYVFGAEASFDDPDPPACDCSELVEWSSARLGVRFVDGAQNQRDTCRNAGTLISVDEGIRTLGALLFRIDEGPSNDHVAISLGNGTTIEARGRAYGVNVFDTKSRGWTHAGLVPGFERKGGRTLEDSPTDAVLGKGDRGEDVKFVQRRLQLHGFDAGSPDGIFGAKTDAQVRAFQKANGLEVDGRVGPATRKALKKKAPAKAPAGQPASIA